jgi:hypothetical protein
MDYVTINTGAAIDEYHRRFANRQIPSRHVQGYVRDYWKQKQLFHVTKNMQHGGPLLWKSAYWT